MARFELDIIDKHEIFFPRLPSEDSRFTLLRVAHERWGPRMRITGPVSGRKVLIFVLSGGGWLRSARGREEIVASAIVVSGGDTLYELWTGPDREMELFIASCGGSDAEATVTGILGREIGIFRLANPLAVQVLFEATYAEACAGDRYAYDICLRYMEIILRRIAVEELPLGEHAPRARQTLNRCRVYIDRHFTELRTIGDVALACGISQAYLTRLFARYENLAPYDYLIRLKLNKAVQLLLTTDRTVADIAAELNYDDPSTFNRTFRRRLGVTPQAYRER